MTAGYFLYAAIGLLLSTPTPFVAVLQFPCSQKKPAFDSCCAEFSKLKENGMWDMGAAAKDHLYFPLSDHWRSEKTRELDCTERINHLLGKLMRQDQKPQHLHPN